MEDAWLYLDITILGSKLLLNVLDHVLPVHQAQFALLAGVMP